MDQKRFLVFIVLSMGILIGWNAYIMPKFLPKKPKAVPELVEKPGADQKDADQKNADQKDADGKQPPADKEVAVGPGDKGPGADDAGNKSKPEADGEKNPTVAEKPADGEPGAKEKPAADKADAAAKLPQFPMKLVSLGSEDFHSDYRQLVTLTSHGAAVMQVQLNDPRYRKLIKDRNKVHPPLILVGEDDVLPYTLELAIPQLAAKPNIGGLNWELVEVLPKEGPHSVAVFKLTLENLEIVKRYELPTVVRNGAEVDEAPAYSTKVELTFRNLGKEPRVINYVLQGPTGLPLENIDNTQKFRDVVVGFQTGPGAVANELMAAKTIADSKGEEWQKPMKYIGIDVQFFAALVCPVPDQLQTPYTKSATQQLIGPNKAEKSEISVQLTSIDLPLAAAKAADGKDAVTHEYRLFAGPKRDDVLPEGAEKVIDFGMFHWISRPMLTLLKTFHKISGSWGIAIICLTIVVRSALFPLSIKQARGAAKMQALQPEIAALKAKHGNDKEKLARAQMELFRKHSYNPAAGCLPVFLQLPIFMGLYQALNHAVDLRMAGFLWIDNLAAPDALFRMPMSIPFLGQEFNLLPLITIVLFVVQQKMFMPPPANEEQAMQQKMMNFMMIFMGVMFYKVPAGLCVYFIASSLWGMGERKLLPKAKPGAVVEPPPSDPSSGRRRPSDSDDDNDGGNGGGGLWAMLLKAAEKDTSARKASSGKRK